MGGLPARALHRTAASQRSWPLPAASAQPVAPPERRMTSSLRTPSQERSVPPVPMRGMSESPPG